jgi:cytochrome c oxidase subunit 4
MAAKKHSLLYKVWFPFLMLFIITIAEFYVAFKPWKDGLKVTLFVVMTIFKAFFITAFFMHMIFERASLVYIILSPLILLLVLFVVLWYEAHELFQLLASVLSGG